MDDYDMITAERHSVQDVEKSYGDLRLSEQSGSVADNLPVSGSLAGDHQSVSLSTSASSGPAAMEISGKSHKAEDRSLSGASSEPSVPLQGGAGGPGGANVMAKMMMMMTSGESHMMPGMSAVPESSVLAARSMLKAGGMPFPDGTSLSKGGMPAMMNKGVMKGGPMEMAKLFDCIIDMSLARADSDDSDNDEDSSTVELPCQYCRRCFSSQMTLKTHILVAHEQDDSVLNLTQLTISSKGGVPKDGSQQSRKPSQDVEVFASGINVKTSEQSSGSESMPVHADLAAGDLVNVRGVKRGRTESKDLETVEKGGASGVEDHTGEEHDQQEPGAVPENFGFTNSDQCTSGMRSERISLGSASRSRLKKTKRFNQNPQTGEEDEDSSVCKPCAQVSFEDVDTKMTEAKNAATSCKDQSAANRSPDGVRDTQGPQAAAAASSEQVGESPPSARRSLRSRKSDY